MDATLYLKRQDGVFCDGKNLSSRFNVRTEDGVMGSLAAWGVSEGDWSGVWQAVLVYLLSGVAAWRDPSRGAVSLAAGLDAVGTRGEVVSGIATKQVGASTTGPKTYTNLCDEESDFGSVSKDLGRASVSCPPTPLSTTVSTSNAISSPAAPFAS
jgi:hypothetical protein